MSIGRVVGGDPARLVVQSSIDDLGEAKRALSKRVDELDLEVPSGLAPTGGADPITAHWTDVAEALRESWASARTAFVAGNRRAAGPALDGMTHAQGALQDLLTVPPEFGVFSPELNRGMWVMSAADRASRLPDHVLTPQLRQAIDELSEPHRLPLKAHAESFQGSMWGGWELRTGVAQPPGLPPIGAGTFSAYLRGLADLISQRDAPDLVQRLRWTRSDVSPTPYAQPLSAAERQDVIARLRAVADRRDPALKTVDAEHQDDLGQFAQRYTGPLGAWFKGLATAEQFVWGL